MAAIPRTRTRDITTAPAPRPARRRLTSVAAALVAVTLLSGVLTSCETTRATGSRS